MKRLFFTTASILTAAALVLGAGALSFASAQSVDECEAITTTLVSDTSTMVSGTSSVAVDNSTTTAGNQVPAGWTASIPDATWIWNDAQNDGAAATGTSVFSRDFTWSSDATSTASLMIATDNSYVVEVNGTVVASSSDEINFTLATQDTIDISGALVNGTNTIEISVTNADNGADNPAGLLYKLVLNGFDCDDVIGDDDDDDDDDDDQEEMVTICHIPRGNPSNAHTITIGEGALQSHLNHGDHEGACTISGTTTQSLKGNGRR
jgi:hypothetical protein